MGTNKIYPQKLRAGDEIRVVAPSHSLSIISQDVRAIANKRLSDLALRVTFGKHIEERDDFLSSSIASRVEDIHDAFSDQNVKAVIAVIGGYNSNQLLRYIDWNIIKNNPKIFCGYSDFTILNNAILAKTGLVTYSGPAYSTFGQELYFEYTLEHFRKCVFLESPLTITPSDYWSDDPWYKDQETRKLEKNHGYLVINKGRATGTIIGANIGTLQLLQGTEYFPDLTDSILFIEDDEESLAHHFDRDLQSLIHLPNFPKVRGVVIGRFQRASQLTNDMLTQIVKRKKELDHIPVMANADFGHTSPIITYPIGGECTIDTQKRIIEITKH